MTDETRTESTGLVNRPKSKLECLNSKSWFVFSILLFILVATSFVVLLFYDRKIEQSICQLKPKSIEQDFNDKEAEISRNKRDVVKSSLLQKGGSCGKIETSKDVIKRSIEKNLNILKINPKLLLNEKLNQRIYNGESVDIRRYPWQVSLFYNGFLCCGGSIINNEWIVTAAHCTVKRRHMKLWKVYSGASDLAHRGTGGSQKRRISNLFQHEEYVHDFTFKKDITLMKLIRPLRFSNITSAICLPDFNETFSIKQKCFVSGWGRLDSSKNNVMFPTVLNHVQVDIIDQKVCKQDDWLGSKVQESMICAGKAEGKRDACQGDSGGPLSCFDNKHQVWKLAGVVSWGIGCGLPKKPGVYSKISYFLPWISKTIEAESKKREINGTTTSVPTTTTAATAATTTTTTTATAKKIRLKRLRRIRFRLKKFRRRRRRRSRKRQKQTNSNEKKNLVKHH